MSRRKIRWLRKGGDIPTEKIIGRGTTRMMQDKAGVRGAGATVTLPAKKPTIERLEQWRPTA